MECARRGESWKQKHLTLYPSSPSDADAAPPARPDPTTIRECLRLFAGLTSFMSKQAFAQASSIGPDGILASSFILFYEPQQHTDRNGDIPQNDDDSDSLGGDPEIGGETRMRETYGLEHAPQAVTEVEAKKAEGDAIPDRSPPDLEAGYYVLIDVAFDEGCMRVDVTGCELKEMEDDEGEDDGAAPVHGAGGVGGVDGLSARIFDRPGCFAAERKLNGCSNMQGNGEQHNAAFEPQKLA